MSEAVDDRRAAGVITSAAVIAFDDRTIAQMLQKALKQHHLPIAGVLSKRYPLWRDKFNVARAAFSGNESCSFNGGGVFTFDTLGPVQWRRADRRPAGCIARFHESRQFRAGRF